MPAATSSYTATRLTALRSIRAANGPDARVSHNPNPKGTASLPVRHCNLNSEPLVQTTDTSSSILIVLCTRRYPLRLPLLSVIFGLGYWV